MVIMRQIFTVLFGFEAHAPSSDLQENLMRKKRKKIVKKSFMLLEEAR